MQDHLRFCIADLLHTSIQCAEDMEWKWADKKIYSKKYSNCHRESNSLGKI